MPKLLLKVASYDSWERNRVEGYAHVTLPAGPGAYEIAVPTWKPALSVRDSLASYFVGGSPELADLSYVGRPTNKLGFETIGSGVVRIRLNVILRKGGGGGEGSSTKAVPNYGRPVEETGPGMSPLTRVGVVARRPGRGSRYASILNSKSWKEMQAERMGGGGVGGGAGVGGMRRRRRRV